MSELDIEYWRIVNDYDKETEGKISLGVISTGDYSKPPHNKYKQETTAPESQPEWSKPT